MKKVFLLIAFLFAVVCYAAPPPEKVSDILTDDVGWVVQDNQEVYSIANFATNVPGVPVIDLIVQEVALCCIGDFVETDVAFNENYTINYAGCTNKIPLNINGSFGFGNSC